MGYYLVNDTDLTAIADVIRTKSGNNNSLIFPNGFSTAISNLSIQQTANIRSDYLACTHSRISTRLSPGKKFNVDLSYNLPIPAGYTFGRVVQWFVKGMTQQYYVAYVDNPPSDTQASLIVRAIDTCPENTQVTIEENSLTMSLVYTLLYIG